MSRFSARPAAGVSSPTVVPGDSRSTGASVGKAGRNVPLAIAVGLGLGGAVLASLYTYRPVFVGLVALSVVYACHEVAVVLRASGRRLPMPPLVLGVGVTYTLAYQRGSQALAVGILLTAIALIVWRLLDGGVRVDVAKDLSASLWILCYVILLAGFAILLVAPSDGARRATCYIGTVVCSDVGGFAMGVLFGKHPLAPSVSPKKSWEGLGGSALACMVGGALFLGLLLHTEWWKGIVFGLAVVVTATVGDLGESLVKRDLGVKDMGTVLPGHGGMMDRLDSLLLTAPIAYLLLTAFAPL